MEIYVCFFSKSVSNKYTVFMKNTFLWSSLCVVVIGYIEEKTSSMSISSFSFIFGESKQIWKECSQNRENCPMETTSMAQIHINQFTVWIFTFVGFPFKKIDLIVKKANKHCFNTHLLTCIAWQRFMLSWKWARVERVNDERTMSPFASFFSLSCPLDYLLNCANAFLVNVVSKRFDKPKKEHNISYLSGYWIWLFI